MDSNEDTTNGSGSGDNAATGDDSAPSDDGATDDSGTGDSGTGDSGTGAPIAPGDTTDGDFGGDTGSDVPPSDGSGGDTQAGLLTAGDVDDNLNLGFFTTWVSSLLQSGGSSLPTEVLADRVTLRIADAAGDPVSNALVTIREQGSQDAVVESSAGTDGVFRFFPAADTAAGAVAAEQVTVYEADISGPDGSGTQTVTIDTSALDDARTIDVAFETAAPGIPDALDIALVIDTTGSMGDELEYLKSEFSSIISGVEERFPGVDMRFGLVLYRDIGDLYVVRTFDFTDSVETMQSQLDAQSSDGGGDYPEAMDQALRAGVDLTWREGNVGRLLFLVADAPPHDENLQATLDEGYRAREAGIRVCPLAASGVATTAEYIMRLCGVLTHGRYLFLTDDSGVGGSHAEPSVSCYIVTRLDSLMIRIIASELAGERVEPEDAEIIRVVGDYQNGVCGSGDTAPVDDTGGDQSL